MPSQPSNKKRTPSPRRESSSTSRRGASPAAPSSSSTIIPSSAPWAATTALAFAPQPNPHSSVAGASQPRTQGTGTGRLSAIILTEEQKRKLFKVVGDETDEGGTSWENVSIILNARWGIKYDPNRLVKTYKFYDNERKRRERQGDLKRPPRVDFKPQEDAEILKLLRWHGWLTWEQISELLCDMMNPNPETDSEGNPIAVEMRDPDGVRSRFNNYLLPHALAGKNSGWLKALRDEEEVWKKLDAKFRSKVKDQLPERAKKYKPEEIITLTHDMPAMNDQVVADYGQPPTDSFEKEVDWHVARLVQVGWSEEDAEEIVENATHAWDVVPKRKREELFVYVRTAARKKAEEPAPGQLSRQGSGMTELAQATDRMSISPPKEGRSGSPVGSKEKEKGKEKEKDDGNGKKRAAASASKDSAARSGSGSKTARSGDSSTKPKSGDGQAKHKRTRSRTPEGRGKKRGTNPTG